MLRRLLLPLAVCALAACSKGDPSSCKAVADHFSELVQRDVGREGDPEREAAARANLPPLADAILELCREQEWSAPVRRCIVAAETAEALEACDPAAAPADPADPAAGDAPVTES